MAENTQKTTAQLKAEYDRLAKETTAAYAAVKDVKPVIAPPNDKLIAADALKAKKGVAFNAWKAAEAVESAKAKPTTK